MTSQYLQQFHTIHAWFTQIRADWNHPCLPLPPFDRYFAERGISAATIEEIGASRLTSTPDARECEDYRRYLKAHRINEKHGAPDPIVEGILFPYFIDEERYDAFGRARGLTWQTDFLAYYEQKGESPPKCLSPKTGTVRATSHLYILPHDQELLPKHSTALCLIEGEAKTAKLSQDIRPLNTEHRRYAVIGVSGVNQALSSPELHGIAWRNRTVFIFFDADSRTNPRVAHAELTLTAFLIAQGVRTVKSCVWSGELGKGYDDYAVEQALRGAPPVTTLTALLTAAVPPLVKYAPSEGYEGLPLESICHGLAKYPQLQTHHQAMLVEELAKLFKPFGLRKKAVQDVFDRELAAERQTRNQQQLEENAILVKQAFGVAKTPVLPENFRFLGGQLCYYDTPLCHMFVVSKYIASHTPDDPDTYVLAFQGKTVLISSEEFTSCHSIAQIFNRNQEILYDYSAKLVQQYISQYWIQNQQHTPIVPYFKNTGWDTDGVFRLPTLDAEGVYDALIQQQFHTHGDAAAQMAFVRTALTEHHAGLFVLLAFAAPLIGLFQLPNYILNVYGDPGEGKSTAAFLMLSQYGNFKELTHTMNASKVGKEVAFAVHKDLPVLLDELNTGGNGDGRQIAQQVVETIYGFYSGKGKTRSTVKITMRKMNEYTGLLCLTSERSLEQIFSAASGMNVGGAYRRTLELPCLGKRALWNYPEQGEKSFFDAQYAALQTDYGHTGAAWLRSLQDKPTQTAIKQRYAAQLATYGATINLKGTENLLSLLMAILPDVAAMFDVTEAAILDNLQPYLTQVIALQQQQINYQIRDLTQKFIDSLESFISLHPTAFDGVCPADKTMTVVHGKVIAGDAWTHVYLRPDALKLLCNEYGFDRNSILSRLEDTGVFKPRLRTVTNERDEPETVSDQTFSMRINNAVGRVLHFVIPSSPDYRDEDLVASDPPDASF